MYFYYGWPDGESNPAFRDRSLPLDSKKPCVMVGRNGSGKTLASNILYHARNIIFGNLEQHRNSLTFIKNINLKWFEVELAIPIVSTYVHEYGELEIDGKYIAWDLVDDGGELRLSNPVGMEMSDFWEVDYHSFKCELTIKLRLEDFFDNPSFSVCHSMDSKGTLEVGAVEETELEKVSLIDEHHGFSAHISSDVLQSTNKSLSDFNITNTESLWKLAMKTIDFKIYKQLYQNHLIKVSKHLDVQCHDKGLGNPDTLDGDDITGLDGSFDPGKYKSTALDICLQKGEEIFPPVNISSVNRIAPDIEPWKKELLEEIVVLRNKISSKIDIEQFGIAGEMLFEILGEFDELIPRKTNFDSIDFFTTDDDDIDFLPHSNKLSQALEHAQFLENERYEKLESVLGKYKSYENWLDILPLWIQRNPDYDKRNSLRRLHKVLDSHRKSCTEETEQLVITALWKYDEETKHIFDKIEHLIELITECFPQFEDFKESENRYKILIDSLNKFQSSDNIELMYGAGLRFSMINREYNTLDKPNIIDFDRINNVIEEHPDLHNWISRYMILYWYAFEMDREILALYETYARVFSPQDTSSLSEFLHIVENSEVLPSGFRNILSMVLGITLEQNSCIYFFDEPEISLHIEWQRKLVKHLRFLLDEFRNNSILLIATHSPDIMLNHLEDIVNFSPQLID